jgi:hypothetical protein
MCIAEIKLCKNWNFILTYYFKRYIICLTCEAPVYKSICP